MAESFSREELRHAPQKRKVDEKSCVTFLLCDPAGTSNELDVQNKWEENTYTHNLRERVDRLPTERHSGAWHIAGKELENDGVKGCH